jgi:FKBP-type peptidyl-prolyl cis-trans isomerase FklB
MGIVRAMKTHTLGLLPGACFGVTLAMAPLVGAQSPSSAPAAPPAAAPVPAKPSLTSEQASYLFGLTFGEQLHSIGLTSNEVLSDAVTHGIQDGLQGKKSTQADRQQVQEYARSMMVAFGARNKSASDEFLARNGHENGVKTTASGLQYKVLAPGDAKAPPITATDQVTVNYSGKLIDGTEFDSSYARGVPATFGVNGVIKGWQEALVLMKPGAKWELYVPPDLAYGASPRPGIPANSLLIFDVEILSAKPAGDAPKAGAAPAPHTMPAMPTGHPTPPPPPASN